MIAHLDNKFSKKNKMIPEENAINDWQLYEKNKCWYWQVWDPVNSKWWTSDLFENYTEASRARDSMISDTYQEEDT